MGDHACTDTQPPPVWAQPTEHLCTDQEMERRPRQWKKQHWIARRGLSAGHPNPHPFFRPYGNQGLSWSGLTSFSKYSPTPQGPVGGKDSDGL